MVNWNAGQYLKFADERTRPCYDLVARIAVAEPRRVIDLGCGPGNSTLVLAERWPSAEITGLDNASSMIDVARRELPQYRWEVRDIADWANNAKEQFDIVFSNAALHWVPDHAALYPKLLERTSGALAVQVPGNFNSRPQQLMRELMPPDVHVKSWYSHEPAFYYDLLAPLAARLDIWEIEYQHIMANAEAIVEWYKGTGLRPYLQALPNEEARERYLAEYLKAIQAAFPPRPDGKVLFPFRRLFVIAYR